MFRQPDVNATPTPKLSRPDAEISRSPLDAWISERLSFSRLRDIMEAGAIGEGIIQAGLGTG
jgi:hypothetical protein